MKGEVTSIDSEKHFKEFLTNAEDKLVVIDFYADWCGPCKMIGPKFKKLAEEFKDIHFGKVNVDECEEVAESQEISAMPTFIFYKNGNKVDEITGANEAKLRKTIEEKK